MSLEKLLGRPAILTTPEEIKTWFHARRKPRFQEGYAQELLHLFHPRSIFFKSLPYDSCVLDVGAGDGSLYILRKWPPPAREDIRVYAYGLEMGQHYGRLDGYELGRWPEKKPQFQSVGFNAVYCSHFIEHIESPGDFIAWCAARLPLQGRLYIEWPSPQALNMPHREELVKAGVDLIISNYRDDYTHQNLPARESILLRLVEAGFFVEQTGVVHFPFIEDELLAHFATNDRDPFSKQSAFWSKTYWAQFIVAAKAR